MKRSHEQLSREEEAFREVGYTTIRRAGAWVLVLGFLLLIFAVPSHQLAMEWLTARSEGRAFEPLALRFLQALPESFSALQDTSVSRVERLWVLNRELQTAMHAYEDALEDQSILGMWVRPKVQSVMLQHLGVGTEQVYVGHDRWLFYRPGLDYVMGPGFLDPARQRQRVASATDGAVPPQPDPRLAIWDFHQQLAQRGIELVVVPTPVKPSIHPEQFTRRISFDHPPLQNQSYEEWMADLIAAGIHVFDPAPILYERKIRTGEPQYLATDTHWRPDAMDAVAAALSDYVRTLLPEKWERQTFRRQTVEHSGMGDLALMLDLTHTQEVFPPEPVSIEQVLQEDGQFWRPRDGAAVLVLGDSFSNIFSFEPMGWGESGGFAEQIAFYLGCSVDRMIRNDGGAFATREMLQRDLARGVDRLAGTRVVVWQFATRELAVGDWRILPLELRTPEPSTFLALESGEELVVSGRVQEISAVPRPGTVPYRDHIVSLHLVDLPNDAEAVIYLQSMIDNVWTAAARLRRGQEITVRLQAWQDVVDRYDTINRSELDRLELQLEEPNWGQLQD